MNENRADTFLRMIRRAQRGRLKIYLGYAAGVGKTYQMLLDGQRFKRDGIDVVVGVVETHGRSETEALIAGLEIIPRRKVSFRGITIEELDLDAVLQRRPTVVLIDELAHTNAPGSRNEKRYQDVEEVLAAGIHVVSTLNVQHLESLYETVESATGVKVRERIPDYVVADADEIVNVDITTEDLRRRLREGKVYTSERIETALDHFFAPSNLEQLRELTLRELAAQIDSRRRDTSAEERMSAPDQVMVCLSSRGPNIQALMRYGSRLAGRLNRNWYAVYVQTATEKPTAIDARTQRELSNNLALAQQLGATVFTYKGDDVVSTILQFAREYRVGHIVLGTPGELSYWKRLLGWRTVVDRLIKEARGVTIVVLDTRAVHVEETAKKFESQLVEPVPDSAKRSDQSPLLEQTPQVRIWEIPIEKERAIQELITACIPDDAELREQIRESVMKREEQGGTFIGEDIILPHTRFAGFETPRLAIGLAKGGCKDEDSGRIAKLVILLISPEFPRETHVMWLGFISRMARDEQWQRMIDQAWTKEEVLDALRQ